MWQRIKNIYHLFRAVAANICYGFPAKKLTIIGVTGTDGKTTTVNLIYHILIVNGYQASMVSTIGATIHGKKSPLGFHVTNPASFPLQRFLHQAVRIADPQKKNYMVLEVTSHGLDQNRVWGIPFEIGVITNVTHEHLDYHKSYDTYLKTKLKLLRKVKIAVVNRDDGSYKKFSNFQFPISNFKWITYGLDKTADVNPSLFQFKTSLQGEFNQYNCLAAIAVCEQLGLSDKQIKDGLDTFITPSGRMEEVKNERGVKIYIDYAHTVNGLEQALKTLKTGVKGRLIAITGAEGYRDEKKRPLMGEIAARLADIVIITAVDPRGLLKQINEQILTGAMKAGGVVGKNVFIEDNREKAIDLAINSLARKGDTIGIFGKGHEQSMNFDGRHEVPWSDYETVKKVLQKAPAIKNNSKA